MFARLARPIKNNSAQKFESLVPASYLDRILGFSENNLEVTYYSPYDDNVKIEDWNKLYATASNLVEERIYKTIDHLPFSVKITKNDKGYNVCYLSLDNSVRANSNGSPLKLRLPEICKLITRIISEVQDCVMLFSESLRPSFDGSNINDRKNEMLWAEIKDYISEQCKLKYLGAGSNNDDLMSFGVSAFCTYSYVDEIKEVIPKRILTEGFGSGCIGIRFNDDTLVWGIHFPLDFKNKADANMGYKAMKGLCDLMKHTEGSVCALGDFNTILGYIEDAINSAIDPELKFLYVQDILTFFGAYYDTIQPREGEHWELL
jgi:hypothetical protein